MRNDPFFKSVQKNLTDMFRVGDKEEQSNSRKTSKEEPSSEVKKKVLELKTVDDDKCIQLIDLYEEDLAPYKPSLSFTSHLYNYQELALAWMLRREGQSSQR